MKETNSDLEKTPSDLIIAACPHLGMADDAETQYTSPDLYNTCFKAQPPHRVSLRHQARVCLTDEYKACKVYQADTPGPLPRDLQGKAKRAISWTSWLQFALLILSILALFVLAYFVLTRGSRAGVASAASTPVVPEAVLPLVEETETAMPSPTVVRPSRTPKASDTPQIKTTTPPQITPGPALETPFGKDMAYLVHMTLEGETLDMLAARYDTSVAVLQAINLPPGQSMWADMPLVVLPGQKDVDDLGLMQAVQVEADAQILDLVARYDLDEAVFRQENDLTGEEVPGGRWIVIHVDEP